MFTLFKKKLKQQKTEIYMGLMLRDGAGSVLLISIDRINKNIDILDEKQFVFTNSWENLIEDVDEVLYQLEQKNNVHTDKIILFLYSHLVDQKTVHIKKPFISKIHDLAREMELELLGFIELHEALALTSQYSENMPLTASVIEVDKSEVNVFVYKGGKIVNTLGTSHTQDLLSDLENLFEQLKGDFLPTKIVLYDALGSGAEIDPVLSHQWKNDLFVQIPHVEIVTEYKLKQALLESFGLQLFGDIEQKNIGLLEQKELSKETIDTDTIDGFIIGEDIKSHEVKFQENESSTNDSYQQLQTPINYESSTNQEIKQPSFISSFFSMIQVRSRSIFSSSQSHSNRMPFFVVIFLSIVLIMGSLFSLEFFFHKASLTLFFKSSTIEKELSLGESVSLKKIEEKVNESETIKTTGSKKIGTKAKGEITVLNLEKNERTLKGGAIFITDKGVKFTLDVDIKVASASSSITSGGDVTIVTGKQKASLTAVDIGKGGNVDKNTSLRLENVSIDSMRASADKTFSGGTEEEIQTVAKVDLDKLKNAVEDKIKKKGDLIVSQKMSGARVVKDLTEITITESKYSKELGQESSDISLNAVAKVTFYTYADDTLKKTIASSLSSSIPEGFYLGGENVAYNFIKAEKKDDKIQLTLKIRAKPKRKFDSEIIKNRVLGKKLSDLNQFLKNEYNVDGYQANVKTTFPILKSRMPFLPGNITLDSKSL